VDLPSELDPRGGRERNQPYDRWVVDADGTLDAGEFSAWFDATAQARAGVADADVPCGGCTACCTSSQFVAIGPDERDTLAHIPRELLFPAPRAPEGTVLLGYDERGRCPMLGDTGCTIYDHRPRACRTYDCRVFAAAGVEPDQPQIAGRVKRWRFTYADEHARELHAVVEAAAAQIGPGTVTNATHHALAALDGADG
jgi:Fe-S-cluster containining protein